MLSTIIYLPPTNSVQQPCQYNVGFQYTYVPHPSLWFNIEVVVATANSLLASYTVKPKVKITKVTSYTVVTTPVAILSERHSEVEKSVTQCWTPEMYHVLSS